MEKVVHSFIIFHFSSAMSKSLFGKNVWISIFSPYSRCSKYYIVIFAVLTGALSEGTIPITS